MLIGHRILRIMDPGATAGYRNPTRSSAESSPPTCVEFLQVALPRLGLSWAGFRRVHRQVCRRISRRLQQLRLAHCREYREYLETHPSEWATLDGFCHISISRFLRERAVFDRLGTEILPGLAAAARTRGASRLQCWSAGCASGEEPYSLAMIWEVMLARRYPGLALRVVATDVDGELLARARAGRYRRSSLREVPDEWRDAAFTRCGALYVVRPALRAALEFHQQDMREGLPGGLFDLILCRYIAFTYFDAVLQRRTLGRPLAQLQPGGALVIGLKEQQPAGVPGVEPWVPNLRIFRRTGGTCGPGPQ